jgi:hypothetical protein
MLMTHERRQHAPLASCYPAISAWEDFGLWSKFFPGYHLGIRKAQCQKRPSIEAKETFYKANLPDARGSRRSFAEVALSTPTMQAVQESWKGLGTRHAIGVWGFVTTFGESLHEYKRFVFWSVHCSVSCWLYSIADASPLVFFLHLWLACPCPPQKRPSIEAKETYYFGLPVHVLLHPRISCKP